MKNIVVHRSTLKINNSKGLWKLFSKDLSKSKSVILPHSIQPAACSPRQEESDLSDSAQMGASLLLEKHISFEGFKDKDRDKVTPINEKLAEKIIPHRSRLVQSQSKDQRTLTLHQTNSRLLLSSEGRMNADRRSSRLKLAGSMSMRSTRSYREKTTKEEEEAGRKETEERGSSYLWKAPPTDSLHNRYSSGAQQHTSIRESGDMIGMRRRTTVAVDQSLQAEKCSEKKLAVSSDSDEETLSWDQGRMCASDPCSPFPWNPWTDELHKLPPPSRPPPPLPKRRQTVGMSLSSDSESILSLGSPSCSVAVKEDEDDEDDGNSGSDGKGNGERSGLTASVNEEDMEMPAKRRHPPPRVDRSTKPAVPPSCGVPHPHRHLSPMLFLLQNQHQHQHHHHPPHLMESSGAHSLVNVPPAHHRQLKAGGDGGEDGGEAGHSCKNK